MIKKTGYINPVPDRYQKNCIIYARISDPNKQSEVSIDAQVRECREFAVRHGLSVIDVITDQQTGTNANRPGFYDMQQSAKKQQYRYILIWRHDRLSRSQEDTYAAIGYFSKYGISIIPIKEQESLKPTLQEKLLSGIYIAMAEYYSAELSVKVCRNMYEITKNGLYFGGATPLGYKVEDKKLVVDEVNAYVIREAFRMYADGHTTRELCRKFNDEGYTTALGKPFTESSFRAILSNERYIGVYSYAATDPNGDPAPIRIENHIPKIIEEDLFRRVQERLRQTSRGPGTAKAKVPYLLKDKLYCGLCGQLMKSDSNKKKNGEVYRYYTCRKDRPGHNCKRKTLQKDIIEYNVVAQTLALTLDKDYVNSMAAVLEKMDRQGAHAEEVKALSAEIRTLKANINTLADKLIAADLGEISMSEHVRKLYEGRIDEYTAKANSLEARRRDLKAERRTVLNAFDLEDWFSELRTYNLNAFEDRQHIIGKYVKQVIAYDDYMEVVLYQPGEIEDVQDAAATLACAKTYIDFREEGTNIEVPERLRLDAADAANTIEDMIAKTESSEDDDDDPDPDGPKGGGAPPSSSGSPSRKTTRPYNVKKPFGARNSAGDREVEFGAEWGAKQDKGEPLRFAFVCFLSGEGGVWGGCGILKINTIK